MYSRISLDILSITLLSPYLSYADSSTQTDWSGGPGLWGLVTTWEDEFYFDNEIDWEIIPSSVVLSKIVLTNYIDNNVPINNVYPADIDCDGDINVIGAKQSSAWWENDGSSQPSCTYHLIDGSFDEGCNLQAVDLDSDGFMDILAASPLLNEISWWRNNGEAQLSFTKCVNERFDVHLQSFNNWFRKLIQKVELI